MLRKSLLGIGLLLFATHTHADELSADEISRFPFARVAATVAQEKFKEYCKVATPKARPAEINALCSAHENEIYISFVTLTTYILMKKQYSAEKLLDISNCIGADSQKVTKKCEPYADEFGRWIVEVSQMRAFEDRLIAKSKVQK